MRMSTLSKLGQVRVPRLIPQETGRFFIIGCQRTGTTLLRLVLECHPEVFCYDELNAYKVLMLNDASLPLGKKWLGFKVPRWTEQLEQNTLKDEGLEETATSFYREDPLLFLLRDVRDTVASMLKLRAEEDSWLARYGPAILEAKIRQRGFRKRYAKDIALLRDTGNALPVVGALFWKYKTQAFFDYRELGWPVCGIRYEDLVSSPESELRRVLSFLGLAWHQELLDHPRFPHRELYSNGTTVGETDPTRPIHQDSVEQWRAFLSGDEEEAIMALAGDLNARIEAAPIVEWGLAGIPTRQVEPPTIKSVSAAAGSAEAPK